LNGRRHRTGIRSGREANGRRGEETEDCGKEQESARHSDVPSN
jgi:hypothetical protein